MQSNQLIFPEKCSISIKSASRIFFLNSVLNSVVLLPKTLERQKIYQYTDTRKKILIFLLHLTHTYQTHVCKLWLPYGCVCENWCTCEAKDKKHLNSARLIGMRTSFYMRRLEIWLACIYKVLVKPFSIVEFGSCSVCWTIESICTAESWSYLFLPILTIEQMLYVVEIDVHAMGFFVNWEQTSFTSENGPRYICKTLKYNRYYYLPQKYFVL